MIMYEDYGVPTGSVPSIAIPMTEPLTVGSILFGPGDRVSETISLKPFNPFSAVPNAPKVIMSPALEKQIIFCQQFIYHFSNENCLDAKCMGNAIIKYMIIFIIK